MASEYHHKHYVPVWYQKFATRSGTSCGGAGRAPHDVPGIGHTIAKERLPMVRTTSEVKR
jgi:hypothetical protein